MRLATGDTARKKLMTAYSDFTAVNDFSNAAVPPTTGRVIDVASRSMVSCAPGFGRSVKSRSLEKIISAIC